MRNRRVLQAMTIVLLLAPMILVQGAEAGVEKVVDKSNWEEVEGLLPEPALQYVKKGDLVLNVGTLDFDPKEIMPPWVQESWSENVGKYELNEEGVIVHASTGKQTLYIEGIPFPQIDPDDPEAAAKVMYNARFYNLVMGFYYIEDIRIRSIDRKAGHERYVGATAHNVPYRGHPRAKDIPNPNKYEELMQILVKHPYDMSGTALMDWHYVGMKRLMFYGYVPAIRRIRRMSPANRSDSMFGTDFTRDDWAYSMYAGKMPDFEWKIIGKQEILMEWVSADLIGYKKTDRGWRVDQKGRDVVKFGYETEGWQGAPWFNTSAIYVKRPVWVVDGKPKDPYYNYGRTITYIDAELYVGAWKLVWDRSEEYWKTQLHCYVGAVSDDKSYRGIPVPYQLIIDDRAQHASITHYAGEDFLWWENYTEADPDQYTLTGFQRLCK